MKNFLSNTIVGSGFMAKNFSKQIDVLEKLNICLYAAGVSNSQIVENKLIEKDKNRIIDFSKIFDQKKILVYLSTCSIYDPSRNKNPYVKNKLYIENLIREKFKNFLIIRLPEVVGKNENKTSLVNFIYHNIKKNISFEIWKNAKRNIIDINDVVLLTTIFLKDYYKSNKIINIANPIQCSATEITRCLEKLTNAKAIYNLVDKGDTNWSVDISEISKTIKSSKINFNENYLYKALKKYYF